MDSQDPNPTPSTMLPGPSHVGAASDAITAPMEVSEPTHKKKSRRGGKNKRNRRKSFISAPRHTFENFPEDNGDSSHVSPETSRLWNRVPIRRMSESSLESETLLDHR